MPNSRNNIFKSLYRGVAFLCFLFFVTFKILVPYATNKDIIITATDKQIVGWSFVIVFLIELVIRLAKSKIEGKINENK
jgi:hypothetical protein